MKGIKFIVILSLFLSINYVNGSSHYTTNENLWRVDNLQWIEHDIDIKAENELLERKVYDDSKFDDNDDLKFLPIGSNMIKERFPLFKANDSNNQSYEDKQFINAIISLEYLSFVGYIPYEERHLYDLNPTDNLWELKNNKYHNIIGVNYYIIEWDRNLSVEKKVELLEEGMEYYLNLQDKNIEGIFNFIELAKAYYPAEDFLKIIENIFYELDNHNELTLVGALLSELYFEENRYDDVIVVYKHLLKNEENILTKVKILNNYGYILSKSKDDNMASPYLNDSWRDIVGNRQYPYYMIEIDRIIASALKQLKLTDI